MPSARVSKKKSKVIRKGDAGKQWFFNKTERDNAILQMMRRVDNGKQFR